MANIYTLDKLDSIEAEAIRGSTAQKGIYVTPNLIRRFNGDGNTAIIFKRLLYCCEQWADEEGWFYQTADTIEQVVGLGYRALQRSVKRLEKMGLLEKKLAGMPYKTHYRVNLSAYLELIKQESSLSTSAQTSLSASDETSPDATDETCSDTSSQQMILNDPSINDTKSDTNSADAAFPEKPKERTDGGAQAEVAEMLRRFNEQVPKAFDPGTVEAIIEQTKTHKDQFDLGRDTLAKRGESAASPTVPAAAGGADDAATAALRWMYHELGSEPPKKGTGDWVRQIEIVGQVLRDRGIKDVPTAALAGQAFGRANQETPHFANPYLSSFPSSFGIYVGKVKKQAQDATNRRARDQSQAAASQAALAERQAARPKPVEDCPIGAAIKRELELQMTKCTFDTYVGCSRFIQRDGVLLVTAPDEFTRDWLENRAADIIRRAAVGACGEVAVEFGVEEAG